MAELPVQPLGYPDDVVEFGTIDSLVPSASDQTLSAATTAPRTGVITNDSSVKVYIRIGAAATATAFHYILAVGASVVLPGATDEEIHVLGSGSPTGRVVFVPVARS